MGDIILYLGLALVGFIISRLLKKMKDKFLWVSSIQTWCIFLLIFTMGTRMGSNREIIDNISTIGISAILFTVIVMSFVLFGSMFVRMALGINKQGGHGKLEQIEHNSTEVKMNKTTLLIIIAIIFGMSIGYFIILSNVEKGIIFNGDISIFSNIAGLIIKIVLSVMLFFVGVDLGFSENTFSNIKSMGYKIIVVVIFNIIFTLSGGVIGAITLGYTIKEGMLVSSGFGWYSLAPGMIMDAGYITISAIAFLHNVLREMIGILLIPFIANAIGYIETTQVPGAAAMDVCLPIVERATKPEIAIYSFISGSILSILVPILVPILINL